MPMRPSPTTDPAMEENLITAGMSVRAPQGNGVIRFVRDGQAITEFADGVYPLPFAPLRANPQATISGHLVLDALRIYKPLNLRLGRGDALAVQELEAYHGALKVLGVQGPAIDDYAENQRRIRAAQPKRSSEEAHAHARHVLSVARDQDAEELE